MRIEYDEESIRYFDMNGEEIHAKDYVLMNGKKEKVYLTENGYLGIDATNPTWIEKGKASPCEFGIYPFVKEDESILIKEK